MKNTLSLYCVLILIANLSACNGLEMFGFDKPSPMPTQTLSLIIGEIPTIEPMKTELSEGSGLDDLSPQKCNRASPGQPLDLTIPDGTMLRPGEIFSKTWRLINDGACPWLADYSVIWFSGVSTAVNNNQLLGKEVLPGEYIDITVDMLAPQKPGLYQSNWKLRSSDGEIYGIGPDGSAPFWVRIKVFDARTQIITPSQTVTPGPLVYNSGNALIKVGERIDLDMSGSTDEREMDVTLSLGKGNKLQLEPKNGTRITLFGMKLPTENDCHFATLSMEPYVLDGESEDMYLCYRSQIGLTGYARIVKIDPGELSINLEYLTWAAP
jgi:hypothetical protein